MYRRKDRKTLPLFPELFPFGGKLNENNRWLRIVELIPWEKLEVRTSFKRRGRPPKTTGSSDRWFKKKQRERNRIEGGIGNSKEHYECDRVRYSIKDGSEIWVRAEILAMNLKTAMNRAGER